jgi:hypothetical protein
MWYVYRIVLHDRCLFSLVSVLFSVFSFCLTTTTTPSATTRLLTQHLQKAKNQTQTQENSHRPGNTIHYRHYITSIYHDNKKTKTSLHSVITWRWIAQFENRRTKRTFIFMIIIFTYNSNTVKNIVVHKGNRYLYLSTSFYSKRGCRKLGCRNNPISLQIFQKTTDMGQEDGLLCCFQLKHDS